MKTAIRSKQLALIVTATLILSGCKKSGNQNTPEPNAPIDYNDYKNGGIHLEVINSDPSNYSDDQLYVSVLGGSPGPNFHSMYIDLKTGNTVSLSNPNALPKVPNPNDLSGSGRFITMGTKLSDIPVDPVTHLHTIPLPFIESARIRLSYNKPLYFFINGGGSLADPIQS